MIRHCFYDSFQEKFPNSNICFYLPYDIMHIIIKNHDAQPDINTGKRRIHMPQFIYPFAEMLIAVPAALFCFLAVLPWLKNKHILITVSFPLIILLCLIGGIICTQFKLRTNAILLPLTCAFLLAFIWCCRLKPSKSVSIFLAACALISCTTGIANVLDAIFAPSNDSQWLCLPAAILHNVFCWLLVLITAWPLMHHVRTILGDDSLSGVWYIFWALPSIFMLLNLFMIPKNQENLYVGRLLSVYAVVSIVLLFLLIFSYSLLFLLLRSIKSSSELQRKNQILQMETSHYETLRDTIEETRRARHDMRHHFTVLSSMAERKAWPELEKYLKQISGSIPDSELTLCENPAVDGVASHYASRCRHNNIPFSCILALPRHLTVPETDLCVILANLLENALEASLKESVDTGWISVRANVQGGGLIVLMVENKFSTAPVIKDGIFASSKRSGPGIGLQSVKYIVERCGGYCKIQILDNIFRVSVILRADASPKAD